MNFLSKIKWKKLFFLVINGTLMLFRAFNIGMEQKKVL